MPNESPEPENYSISEMMNRLKERSSAGPEQGELVVRADGTQAIKVRKRKRRTEQPDRDREKQKKQLRTFQLVASLVVLIVLALLAAGGLFYYNGSPYRNKVLDKITAATGAKAEVTQFRVTPIGASASTLDLTWPEGGIFHSFKANQVSATLNFGSFLGQPWSGDEVTAEQVQMMFGAPQSEAQNFPSQAANQNFLFTRLRCAKGDLFFGNPNNPSMRIQESEISLYPNSQNGRSELRLNQGTFGLLGMPAMKVDRGYFAFINRQMEVVMLRLEELPTKAEVSAEQRATLGSVELAGKLQPTVTDRSSTLDIKRLDNFPLEQLVGNDFERILSGRIELRELPNSNFISFVPGSLESQRTVIAFRGGFSSRLTLSNLPFLTELATLLDDSGMIKPTIDSGATGILRKTAEGIVLEELRLEAKSRMVVRGTLKISPRRELSGMLEVGLPASQVSSFLRSLDSAFSPPREGMRWIELEISGTTTAPVDNFSRKIASLRGRSPSQSGEAVPTPGSLFEEVTKPR